MNNRVFLQHEKATTFFENAKKINPQELERRDRFLRKIDETLPYHCEGTDMLVEIPEIDLFGYDTKYSNDSTFSEVRVVNFASFVFDEYATTVSLVA